MECPPKKSAHGLPPISRRQRLTGSIPAAKFASRRASKGVLFRDGFRRASPPGQRVPTAGLRCGGGGATAFPPGGSAPWPGPAPDHQPSCLAREEARLQSGHPPDHRDREQPKNEQLIPSCFHLPQGTDRAKTSIKTSVMTSAMSSQHGRQQPKAAAHDANR
jgi:hypothetical protein